MRIKVLATFFLFINVCNAEVVCGEREVLDPMTRSVRMQRVCYKCEYRQVLDRTSQTVRTERVCAQVSG